MDWPTSLPWEFIYSLIKGDYRIDAIESPVATFGGYKFEPFLESLDTPAVSKLNTLIEERKVLEFLHYLADLPAGLNVVVKVQQKGFLVLYPSGHYRFIVGEPSCWKYPLLLIYYSKHFQNQIAVYPRSIIEIAKMAQLIEIDFMTSDFPLHLIIEENTIQANGALLALTYQLNAYGAAYVLHPLASNKLIISIIGQQPEEVSINTQTNNLRYFIALRRAMDYNFDKAVDSIFVDVYAISPTIQQLTPDIKIEYPTMSINFTVPGARISRLEKKLCAVTKKYFHESVQEIIVKMGDLTALNNLANKVELLKTQIKREKEGRKETWGEHLHRINIDYHGYEIIDFWFYVFINIITGTLFYILAFFVARQLDKPIPPIGSHAYFTVIVIWPLAAILFRSSLSKIPIFGEAFVFLNNLGRFNHRQKERKNFLKK